MSTAAREDLPSVVHCLRAPVGGVFRHVRDLATGQAKLGLNVGIICDETTGAEQAKKELARIAQHCTLGVHRVPMQNKMHPSDVMAYQTIVRICKKLRPTIVHGHGAKGGAFARLLRRSLGARVVYTPHGGVLHYKTSSIGGYGYFKVERFLQRRTDGLIFVSDFCARKFVEKIGPILVPYAVVHNGLGPGDFAALPAGSREFSFVFAGEIRKLKGLDTLLEAMVTLNRERSASLLVCGNGPDQHYFETRINELGLQNAVTMTASVFPVTDAFAKAECVVIPSHAESLPYIVLEAAAAAVPLISTSAGGIPEIFGPYANLLVPPGDTKALSKVMLAAMDNPDEARRTALRLATHVKEHFQIDSMISDILALYQRVREV